ncbi:hypothetical protein [Actinopolymorpha alba]|uniref:hypothetical protein n=1 Tax=Actinopolymorpha alba TaxID=533267 RepID=UPI0003A59BE4|nr:hypothetical protein [Actinopolymorpha alba]
MTSTTLMRMARARRGWRLAGAAVAVTGVVTGPVAIGPAAPAGAVGAAGVPGAAGAVGAAGVPGVGSSGQISDPTPHGPQRPYEPDVPGPVTTDTVDVTMERVAGTATGVRVRFDRSSRTLTGEKPAPVRRFVITFDKKIGINAWAFPTCSLEALKERGPSACPAGSQIGSGLYVPWVPAGEPQPEPAEVYALNGWAHGYPAVFVHVAGITLVQTIEKVTGPHARTYGFGKDEIIPPSDTPPMERASTARFVLDFGATTTVAGVPVSYLTAKPAPAYDFGYFTQFVTGQEIMPTPRATVDWGTTKAPGS